MASKNKANYIANDILGELPRRMTKAPNAFVYLDASGRLQIEVCDTGNLTIDEDILLSIYSEEF